VGVRGAFEPAGVGFGGAARSRDRCGSPRRCRGSRPRCRGGHCRARMYLLPGPDARHRSDPGGSAHPIGTG